MSSNSSKTIKEPSNSEVSSQDRTKKGSLIVIGTGIRTVGQLTTEAIAWMKEADSLLYIVGDPIAEEIIKQLNPNNSYSLSKYYEENKPRIDTYNLMVEHIVNSVREGNKTVVAFYGHPGVFAYPAHKAIQILRSEGYYAKMLPAVSAEDCLFADLGIDPGTTGCQSYEATDFLVNNPIFDTSSQLILWQIGILGDVTFQKIKYNTGSMPLLVNKLLQSYPANHSVVMYEAASLLGTEPMIATIPLYSLSNFPVTTSMTLYIPPTRIRTPDPMTYYWMSILGNTK